MKPIRKGLVDQYIGIGETNTLGLVDQYIGIGGPNTLGLVKPIHWDW